ncbi:AEC family transporter [Leucobacter sp. GX24907]
MMGVVQGFALILGIIGAGYIAARCRIVVGEQRLVLNKVAFYVATPALLFSVLHRSDTAVLLSPVILVTTSAAIIVAALYITVSRLWFRQDRATTALGATCAGYVNSNNLGLPIAVYILGDAAYVAPLLLVQLVLFAPIILAVLDSTRGNRGGALIALGRASSNPVIIASILGFLVAQFEVPIPDLVIGPVDMLGDAAIPMVLLSFGISLHGQRALQPGSGLRFALTASGIKILVMPLVAFGLATAIGLSAHEVFVATVIGALPTAQNVYNYAATYQRAEIPVRDTVFLTTFASLPVIAAIALLLNS